MKYKIIFIIIFILLFIDIEGQTVFVVSTNYYNDESTINYSIIKSNNTITKTRKYKEAIPFYDCNHNELVAEAYQRRIKMFDLKSTKLIKSFDVNGIIDIVFNDTIVFYRRSDDEGFRWENDELWQLNTNTGYRKEIKFLKDYNINDFSISPNNQYISFIHVENADYALGTKPDTKKYFVIADLINYRIFTIDSIKVGNNENINSSDRTHLNSWNKNGQIHYIKYSKEYQEGFLRCYDIRKEKFINKNEVDISKLLDNKRVLSISVYNNLLYYLNSKDEIFRYNLQNQDKKLIYSTEYPESILYKFKVY